MTPIFTGCPHPGCDAPAEVVDRTALGSTDGAVVMARVIGACGHHFLMPLDWLTPPAEQLHPAAGAWDGAWASRRFTR